ncbi:hypothetical protein FIBSPDRAFT_320847 [Athelia psychrophila]|uniref:Uncharacterized protein n=1 Tax=Athelia psychrophila TaxID=1759441 RepID=A0A166QI89_9AGAM|nr:hypothetical protein FIBSPDRAFT_320847 [Fibularhizoctonia sp. CBS 109695]
MRREKRASSFICSRILMDRREFNSPAAAASLAEQGVGTIFGATYWTGYDSEPLRDFLSPRLPLHPRLRARQLWRGERRRARHRRIHLRKRGVDAVRIAFRCVGVGVDIG